MTARRQSGSKKGHSGALGLKQLQKGLDAGRRAALYLCVGPEYLLARRALELIESAILDEAARVWAKDDLVCGDASLVEMAQAITQAPMLGGARLVILRSFDKLRKAERDHFSDLLAAQPDTTTLVVVAEKLDGRTKLTRMLKERAVSVACEPLPAAELPTWIEQEFMVRAPKLTVTRRAAERLAELAGPELGTVSGEIEKLILYQAGGGQVDSPEIDRVVAGGVASDLSELLDAFGGRDRLQALGALGRLLEAGVAPVQIVAYLGYRVADLLRATEAPRSGWIRREVAAQVGRYSIPELRRGAVLLYEADGRLKSSRGAPTLVLETWLNRVMTA